MLFLFRSLSILSFLHEVINFFLALLEQLWHFLLRDWRISCIHLQLCDNFTNVILAEEKGSDIEVLSKLRKPRPRLFNFFFRLLDSWRCWTSRRIRCILSKDSLAGTADLLLAAGASGGITLLDHGAGSILLAHGHLCAVDAILAVEHVCAV